MENTTIFWDQSTNTLHIQKPVIPKLEKRGFIVQTVDSEEELNKMMQSNAPATTISLSPVLATNEDEALEFIKSKGKIPINILSYEMIHFQSKLLNDLATKENIELVLAQSNFTIKES